MLGVGEEVVWALAAEVGFADFGVGEAECGLARGAWAGHQLVAHQLFEEFALFGCHFEGGGPVVASRG